jgi:hypothetical protein
VARKIGQADRSDHEHYGYSCGNLRQEPARTGGAENSLAGSSAERRAYIRAFSRLEKDNNDQKETDDDMQNGDCQGHLKKPLLKRRIKNFYSINF